MEGVGRHKVSLHALDELSWDAPALFRRFNAVSDLALELNPPTGFTPDDQLPDTSIGDDGLELIAALCPNLERLKISGCREISNHVVGILATNCCGLRQIFFECCHFGFEGISAVLAHCPLLEEISVACLNCMPADIVVPPRGAPSLKVICLIYVHWNGPPFMPLVAASPNLRIVRLSQCYGDWGSLLEEILPECEGLWNSDSRK